jgi:hypothetical protein
VGAQPLVLRASGRSLRQVGGQLRVCAAPDRLHFFDPATGRRL